MYDSSGKLILFWKPLIYELEEWFQRKVSTSAIILKSFFFFYSSPEFVYIFRYKVLSLHLDASVCVLGVFMCRGLLENGWILSDIQYMVEALHNRSLGRWNFVLYKCTVEPCYNKVLGTMKITLLYRVSHYIRVKKQRNIKSWDQQNYLVIRGVLLYPTSL